MSTRALSWPASTRPAFTWQQIGFRRFRNSLTLRNSLICNTGWHSGRFGTRSSPPAAASATARDAWPNRSFRRCFGRRTTRQRGGLAYRRGCLRRLQYGRLHLFHPRRAASAGYRGRGNFTSGGGFIVVEPRLQRLGCFGSILHGSVSRLFAALQALAHPFAHIALVAHWRRARQSVAGGRRDTGVDRDRN